MTPKKIKIYTKTGDDGETSLFSGQRVPKNDPFVEALGSVDECNSAIGIAITFMGNESALKQTRHQLEIIQNTLFDLGASLATPRTRASSSKIDQTRFDADGSELLEKWIDQMEETLSELHTFYSAWWTSCRGFFAFSKKYMSTCRTQSHPHK